MSEGRRAGRLQRAVQMRCGPGEVWTGRRRFVCDAVTLKAVLFRDSESEEQIESVRIEQLHDVNMERRRTPSESREHLRQCLRAFMAEGMLITWRDRTWFVRPDSISTSDALSLHVLAIRDPSNGPLDLELPPEDG